MSEPPTVCIKGTFSGLSPPSHDLPRSGPQHWDHALYYPPHTLFCLSVCCCFSNNSRTTFNWSMPPSADRHHCSQQVPLPNLSPSPKAPEEQGEEEQGSSRPSLEKTQNEQRKMSGVKRDQRGIGSVAWFPTALERRRPSISPSTS